MNNRLFLYGVFKVKYIFNDNSGKGKKIFFSPSRRLFCKFTSFKYNELVVVHIPYFNRRFAVENIEGIVRKFIDPEECEFLVRDDVIFLKVFGFYNEKRRRTNSKVKVRKEITSGINGLDPFGGSCVTGTKSFRSWTKGPSGPKGQTGYGQTNKQRKK